MPKKVRAKKGPKRVGNPERTRAFKEAREQYGFREYDLHAYAGQLKQSWIGDHLDINTVQKVAPRAFQATFQSAIGKRGRPRFTLPGTGKGRNQFDSLEGKNQAAGILLREVGGQSVIKWKGLVLNLVFPRMMRSFSTGWKVRSSMFAWYGARFEAETGSMLN